MERTASYGFAWPACRHRPREGLREHRAGSPMSHVSIEKPSSGRLHKPRPRPLSTPRLDSAIGASDGRVYERLMEAATREPLNRTPARERYERVLRPLMRGKL